MFKWSVHGDEQMRIFYHHFPYEMTAPQGCGLSNWRGGFVYNVDKKGHMRKVSQKKSLGSSRVGELDETSKLVG